MLQIDSVSKLYKGGDKALDNISFSVEQGEFISVIGKSGAGKTTLFRLLNGMIKPTAGRIIINNQDFTKLKGRKKRDIQKTIGTIYQDFCLVDTITCLDNVLNGALADRNAFQALLGIFTKEQKEYARKQLEAVGLSEKMYSYAGKLSGGQKQRVAIARALVNEPEILMLDEPLGALDLKMRKEMQIELKNMHDQLGITFIYVTHDQEEALTMSDKIVVLSEGKIQQIGTPEDIYNEPKNAFVADFIGESNIFKGIMTGHMKVRFCGGEFVGMDDVPEGTLVDVVIRPEDVIITKPEDGTVVGEVTSVIFKGMHYEVAVESGKYEMIIRTTRCYHVGDTVGMQLEPDGIHVMIAEDHTTSFVTTINGDYTLDFNGKIISCDLTQVIPKTKMSDGVLVDENGENVDVSKFSVVVSIQPDDIEMSDDVTAGLVSGKIINLIYKGDHYSYVIRTEYGHDLIVDDEYLWNMDDQVGLIMPEEKMKFQLKK